MLARIGNYTFEICGTTRGEVWILAAQWGLILQHTVHYTILTLEMALAKSGTAS